LTYVRLMKNTTIFFSLLMLLFAFSVEAQRPGGRPGGGPEFKLMLKGQIVDNANTPLSFATISLYSKKDDSLLDGTLTGDDGKFSMNVKPGPSYLVVEYISYEKTTIDPLPISRDDIKAGKRSFDLGQIQLFQSSTTLDEIEIRAEKSEAQFKLDKTVFNVGKDLANKGGTAEEILDNVPSVTVDIDGNVSLRGNEGVRILIDGRPSGLVGAGNTNGLRNIPSNLIEQVEVITNPSSRYEAEGMAGIINIVLKKNKGSGFNGSFDLTGGYPERAGASANINYRKGKLNWFANYGLNYRENPGGGFNYARRTVGDDVLILDQDRDMNRTGLSNSLRLGLDYFLTDKSQLTGSFLYRKSDEDNSAVNTYLDSISIAGMPAQFVEKTVRTDTETEDELNQEYSLNYRREFSSRKHRLDISAQFREKSEDENSFLEDVFLSRASEIDTTHNAESDMSWLFKLDYVHPFSNNHKWEGGAFVSLRDITNDFEVLELIDGEFVNILELSNDFRYDENIIASYLSYGNGFGDFSYQAGIRAEYTDITTELLDSDISDPNAQRDYLDWFPSAFLGYKLSESNSLQVSYSRRIRRPRFWDLNPFFTFSDNRNFFGGNPTVNPQYTNSYELGYIKYWDKATLSSSLFYRATNASIQRVLSVDQMTGNTLRVPLNSGEVKDIGLDFTINYKGADWININGNFNIFQNKLSVVGTEVESVVFDYYQTVRSFAGSLQEFNDLYAYELNETDNVTWNGRITTKLSFWDSDLQLRANYRGARETSQGSTDPIGSIDIGWSKDFLEAKNLTLTLSIRDLFNSRKRNSIVDITDFYQESEFQWRARTASLTASYRINQKKKRFNRDSRGGGYEGGEF